MSNLIRGISENGGAVLCAIDSTAIVREMERVHKTSAVTSAALGRLLTGAAMMATYLKSEDNTLTVRVKGGGPAGTVLAVANGRGEVKGYVENPVVEIPPRADGHLNVGGAVGCDGTLSVVQDIGMKEPYVGQVPLVSGEIAEDITSYYAVSQQTPTVCALGVLVNADLSIRRAGGYMLQLLPGATEEEITRLEKNIAAMPAVTTFLEEERPLTDIMEMVLDGFNPNILDEQEVVYRCDCSKERVERALLSMSRGELQKLADEDPNVEVCCQFCDKVWQLDAHELLAEKDAQ